MPLVQGCATNPVTGRSELRLVSDRKANNMGNKAFPQLRQDWGGDYNYRQMQAYVESVGQSLARVSHSPELPFSFRVTNSSSINAITLPGGKIFITRGLMAELENEAQLAAVLGHEIGHATARHGQTAMSWGIALQSAVMIASIAAHSKAKSSRDVVIATTAIQAGMLAANMVRMGYSRDQELQADELGVDYMIKAGYHPEGAIKVQELLASKEKKKPTYFQSLMRSHPVNEKRVKNIRRYVYAHEAGAGFHRKGDGYFASRYKEKTEKLMRDTEAFKHHDKALKHFKNKETGVAREELEEAIKIAPDQAEFYILKGDMALERKDYDGAEEAYGKAKQLAPDYYKPHARLGSLAKLRKKNDVAIKHHKKAMTLNPNYSRSYVESGLAYFEKKDYNAAAKMLQTGTSLNFKQNGNAYSALGYSYEKLGMSREAYGSYQNAVRFGPNDESTGFAKKRINYLDRFILRPR